MTSSSDVNECDELREACIHGQCLNNQGSFRCECFQGFSLALDGRTCEDSRSDLCYSSMRDGRCFNPSAQPTSRSTCCCSMEEQTTGVGWGSPCTPCPRMGSTEYARLCPFGPGTDLNGGGRALLLLLWLPCGRHNVVIVQISTNVLSIQTFVHMETVRIWRKDIAVCAAMATEWTAVVKSA